VHFIEPIYNIFIQFGLDVLQPENDYLKPHGHSDVTPAKCECKLQRVAVAFLAYQSILSCGPEMVITIQTQFIYGKHIVHAVYVT